MNNKKLVLYRDAIVTVGIIQLVFVLLSSWQIFLNLKGFDSYFGLKIFNLEQLSIALIIGTSCLAVVTIYLVIQLIKMTRLEKDLAVAQATNENAQNSIQVLNSHRHDFMNHLQVILGYLQLNKKEAAQKYIIDIHNELKGIRSISNLEMPGVAVLLFTKKEEASKHGIKIDHDIQTDLSRSKISQVDLVRILTNLVDNAIFELKKLNIPDDQKLIQIGLQYVEDTLVLQVSNTHSVIEDTDKIFEYGYTTKGNKGTGIGLYTIKKLVREKYGGSIEVKSNPTSGTTFTIYL